MSKLVKCSFLFPFLSTLSLQALPSGNPAQPVFSHSRFERSCLIDVCNSLSLASGLVQHLTFGCSSDHVFSESAAIKGVTVKTKSTSAAVGPNPGVVVINSHPAFDFDVLRSSLHSSSAFVSVSLPDKSPIALPLFDLSFTAKVGGLKLDYRIPMSAYRNFDVSPLASMDERFEDWIDVQTNYGVVWELSIKKVIWKDGVSFIGIGIDYRHGSCPINFVAASNQSHVVYFSPTEEKVGLKEWSFNCGLTTYVNDYVMPYIAITTGNASRTLPVSSLSKLSEQLSTVDNPLAFVSRKLTNYHRANVCCGVTNYASDRFYFSIEGRWGYQRAFHVNSGMSF